MVAELTEELDPSDLEEVRKPEEAVRMSSITTQQAWQLFVDGAANQKRSRIGIVIISPEGITLEKSLRLGFLATNNESDYEALQVGLVAIQKLGGKSVRPYCDSRLIVGQVRGDYKAKDLRCYGT